MNSSFSENQTSFLVSKCSEAGYFITSAVIVLDFIVNLPIQSWVLWLSISNFRNRGHLAASEIFKMNMSALELFSTILYPIYMIAYSFKCINVILFVMFFSGSYMVGRPIMNSLICVERYIAVAHPVTYLSPAFVKYRYIAAGLVWMLILSYGGHIVSIYPEKNNDIYIMALSISILVIAACSLGVLKILLRPSPGEAQKKGMNHQKKRSFIIITAVLICVFVTYGLDLLIFSIKSNFPLEAFCLLSAINMFLLQQGILIHPVLYLSKHGKLSCIRKLLNKIGRNIEMAAS